LAGVVVVAVVLAWAECANRAAKPTALTALSWVARQVSLDRRLSPWVRDSPTGSS
jgi:hypothetical protein